MTFTVPEVLRRPVRSHPRQALPILLETSASALLDLCRDHPRFLGAVPGLTAVLHTWTRQQEYHPHVHILATGGGLGPDAALLQPPSYGFAQQSTKRSPRNTSYRVPPPPQRDLTHRLCQ